MNQTDAQPTKIERQLKEESRIGTLMDHGAGAGLLNPYAQTKVGSDTIFAWWGRYQDAVASGIDAVNGTIGALLEDDGNLAINAVVDKAVRQAPPVEIAAYAPLKGLPAFLDLAKTLALVTAEGIWRQWGSQSLPLPQPVVRVRCIWQRLTSPTEATMSCCATDTGAHTRDSSPVVI